MGGSQEHTAHSYMQPVFLQPDTFPPALEMSVTHNEINPEVSEMQTSC